MIEEMKKHPLYQKYPASYVPNLGGSRGFFENIVPYRGFFENIVPYAAMAFDKKDEKSVAPLCSEGEVDSPFVWAEAPRV